jgi:hypothetical protein
LALAAAAVARGSGLEAHWDALAAYAENLGIDHVAAELARRAQDTGASARWWRCNVVLCQVRTIAEGFTAICELMDLEAKGEGPSFDIDSHALQVSQTMRLLQHHLDTLRAGNVTARELRAASIVVQTARVAWQVS